MRLFLISILLLVGCASTETGAIKKAGNDKRVFFTTSKKEGYEFLKMQDFKLRKLDSIKESTGKVYLFFYKDQQ